MIPEGIEDGVVRSRLLNEYGIEICGGRSCFCGITGKKTWLFPRYLIFPRIKGVFIFNRLFSLFRQVNHFTKKVIVKIVVN